MQRSCARWIRCLTLPILTAAWTYVAPAHAQNLCDGGAPDGTIDPSEECDDGNALDQDGCSSACRINPGYECAPPISLDRVQVQGASTNADWVTSPTSSVQTSNSNGPTVGYMEEADAFAAVYTFDIRVETTQDDDYIGFVLGYQSGELVSEDGDTDYLLVDWKQASQVSTLEGCAPALAGLAVSRIRGRPSNAFCEFWEHSGVVEEIYRPAAAPVGLGNVGWADNQTHRFRIRYSERSLRIDIDGIEQLNVAPESGEHFPAGRIGFYGLSQQGVRYTVVNPTAPSVCNRPPQGENAEVYTVIGAGSTAVRLPTNYVEPDGDGLDGSQLRIVEVSAGAVAAGPAEGEAAGTVRLWPDDDSTPQRYDVVYEFCDNHPVIPLCTQAEVAFLYNDSPTLVSPPPGQRATRNRVTAAELAAVSSVNIIDGGWDERSLAVASAANGVFGSGPVVTDEGGTCSVSDNAVLYTGPANPGAISDVCHVQLCERLPGPSGNDASGRACATTAILFESDGDGDTIPNSSECADQSDCPDTDGDGTPDWLDDDDDGDSIPTSTECTAADACPDTDEDGVPDYLDTDDDGDGLPTIDEARGPRLDIDHDGLPNYVDDDSDNDGILDAVEAHDRDGDGSAEVAAVGADRDQDGLDDAFDPDCDDQDACGGVLGQPASVLDRDQDGLTDQQDADADGDGILDREECGPGSCLDSDNDGRVDYLDEDSDDDGISDAVEGHDGDGDGEPDMEPAAQDENRNGVDDAYDEDCSEASPCDDVVGVAALLPDLDDDGRPDYRDADDDGDGTPTVREWADGTGIDNHDVDGDGVVNARDLDSDGDEVPDSVEADTDVDEDGIPDYLDPNAFPIDSDDDGIPDITECGGRSNQRCPDTDGDGTPDHLDEDDDNDGLSTRSERPEGDRDSDNDGTPDHLDDDDDNDGLPTRRECSGSTERCADTDEDGTPDHLDSDDDDDGIPTTVEVNDGERFADDPDQDDLDNWRDTDSDGDDAPDARECTTPDNCADSDGNGIPDYLDPATTEPDTDGDGLPDRDECVDLERPEQCPDTDGDGQPDFDDDDDDGDGVSTAEEVPQGDTDGDGVPDYLDNDDDNDGLATRVEGLTSDVDGDGIPDRLDEDQAGLAGGATCGVGSGPGSSSSMLSAAWWLLALFAVRRRRPLGPRPGTARGLWLLGLCLCTWNLQAPARAQTQQGSLTLNRYRPAAATEDGFAINLPNTRGDGDVGAFVQLNYALNPLVLESPVGDADNEQLSVVKHMLIGHANVHLTLADRLLLFVEVPVNLLMRGDGVSIIASADNTSLGDPAIGARLRLLGEPNDTVGLALQASATAPLGHEANDNNVYSGSNGFTAWPQALLEIRGSAVAIAVNAGARYSKTVVLLDEKLRHELTFGLGVRVPLSENTHLHLEGYGSTYFTDFLGRETSPLEALGGIKSRLLDRLVLGVAGGPGITRGVGSPDVRVLGMIGLAPPTKEPIRDRDGDGLLDPDDACPDAPEDIDNFQDEDGCPDPDNDDDKILDGMDACPNSPEDPDGYDDANGCPDPDNDGDGIADVEDECRNEPGIVEYRGCPPPDRDGDTVIDRIDNCPDEPGPPENAGCVIKPVARLSEDKIELLQKVYFTTGSDEVLERSFIVLDDVAKAINGQSDITQIRIEGHTDSIGSASSNEELSRRRAEAVRRHLVARGVDESLLEAIGHGESQPIDTNDTAEGRSNNRRVEFNLERATPTATQPQAPEQPGDAEQAPEASDPPAAEPQDAVQPPAAPQDAVQPPAAQP